MLIRNDNEFTIYFDVENSVAEMEKVLHEYFSHMSFLDTRGYCYCETSLFSSDFGIPPRFISLWPHMEKPLKISVTKLSEALFDHYRYAVKWKDFESYFVEMHAMLTIRLYFDEPAEAHISMNSIEWATMLIEGCTRSSSETSGFAKFYV